MTDEQFITREEIQEAFGAKLPAPVIDIGEVLSHAGLSFSELDSRTRDRVIVQVMTRILEDSQVVGEPGRTRVWSSGWHENLEAYRQSKRSDDLVPKFMRPSEIFRWQGRWVRTKNTRFEVGFAEVLRAHVFNIFMAHDVREIHEFGAGTGWNLNSFVSFLSQAVEAGGSRKISFHGSDFVESGVQVMNLLSETIGVDLHARLFDMRTPDDGYSMTEGRSGVFTFGALEQLAGDYHAMFDFLCRKKPKVVVSIEPDADTYNLSSVEDFLAYWFQTRRGYSRGMISELRRREAMGKVELISAKRIGFGSMMMEGYNCMVWRPL